MDASTTALAAGIGSRVRQQRQERGWTLDRLATAAGVSRRMVVNIEQGTVNPSVGTLLRIGDALGVRLPALVDVPERGRMTVTRSGEGAVLWQGAADGRAVLVAGTRGPDVVELWDWTLGPGDRHTSEAHATGTKELVHVHEGTVVIEAADESVTLQPGDAAAFDGAVAHAYANQGPAPARFSLAVLEPDAGASTRSAVPDA